MPIYEYRCDCGATVEVHGRSRCARTDVPEHAEPKWKVQSSSFAWAG